MGIAFPKTELILTVHSPTQWGDEGNHYLPDNPVEAYKLYYMEQYCTENADLVIFTTQHMRDYIAAKQWSISQKKTIMIKIHTRIFPYIKNRLLNSICST